MRHMKRGRRLSRTSSHRKAMFRNMVASLFTNGRIVTTPAKAKEARPFAERLITLAKKGADNLAARRRAIRLLHDPALVRSLFEDLGVRYKDRNGGYTRILHLSKTRVGDGAPLVLFELVEGGAPAVKNKEKAAVASVAPELAQSAMASAAADAMADQGEVETPTQAELDAEVAEEQQADEEAVAEDQADEEKSE